MLQYKCGNSLPEDQNAALMLRKFITYFNIFNHREQMTNCALKPVPNKRKQKQNKTKSTTEYI